MLSSLKIGFKHKVKSLGLLEKEIKEKSFMLLAFGF